MESTMNGFIRFSFPPKSNECQDKTDGENALEIECCKISKVLIGK